MHGRSSREGWARARGARGRRRLGRDCGDVCSVRESGTILKGGKAPPEAVSGRATYTTATANSAAIYSRLGINTVIFQTQSMLLQASRRIFP